MNAAVQGVRYIKTKNNEAIKSDMKIKVMDIVGSNVLNASLKLKIDAPKASFQTETELSTRMALVAYAALLSEEQLTSPMGKLIAIVVKIRTLKGLQDLVGLEI